MADDAIAFLENWTETRVAADAPADVDADTLAEECVRDAESAGFTREQIEEAASELSDDEHDLIAYFEAALQGTAASASDDEEE